MLQQDFLQKQDFNVVLAYLNPKKTNPKFIEIPEDVMNEEYIEHQ